MTKRNPACPYCGHVSEPADLAGYPCPGCNHRLVPTCDVETGDWEDLLPAVVGDYTVVGPAGRGGMGRVFQAVQGKTGATVAIKFPAGGPGLDDQVRQRFEREIDVLKRIVHPNVVRILDHGVEAGCPYFTMEWLDGQDMASILADRKARLEEGLPFASVSNHFLQLCGALSALHAAGIVHRDVKPANIMLMADRNVKLIDLGIAKCSTGPVGRTTGRVGTFGYMAPELLSGTAEADSRADAYGLGVVLYEMLTNHLPMGNFKLPSHINRTVPAWFDDLVMSMLEHRPEDRPASVAYVAAFVADIFRQEAPSLYDADENAWLHRSGRRNVIDEADLLPSAVGKVGLPPATGRRQRPLSETPIEPRGITRPIGGSRQASARRASPRALNVVWIVVGVGLIGLGYLALQQRWPGPGKALTVDLGKGLTMEFIRIQAGTFEMGAPDGETDAHYSERPRHTVQISKPFYLGKYEVTQEQYQAVAGANPSWFSATGGGADKVQGLDTRKFPVEEVSWRRATAFCQKLTTEHRGRMFRLPTEAEWEYACRAGTTTRFHFGDMLNGRQANCNGNHPTGTSETGPYLERTCSVGSYPPNAWGLYDMHGNVCEWCADWDDGKYYNRSPAVDPICDDGEREYRILRGGSWGCKTWATRAAYRGRIQPWFSFYRLGFRVAIDFD
jgi:formylglycine-generating enzyme required for sulfatase activity/serine/threonine protein kinase